MFPIQFTTFNTLYACLPVLKMISSCFFFRGQFSKLRQTFSLLYFQLGVVLLEQGKASQALAYLDKALEIDPEHGQALLNSAILLQEIGRPELRLIARERLLKLLVMDGEYLNHLITSTFRIFVY